MSETIVNSWVPLVAVATGVLVVAVATRGVSAVVHVVVDEVNYRAGMGELGGSVKWFG